MTSHGDETAAVEAMKAGALDYLVKSQAAWPSCRVDEREHSSPLERRDSETPGRTGLARERRTVSAALRGLPLPYQSMG